MPLFLVPFYTFFEFLRLRFSTYSTDYHIHKLFTWFDLSNSVTGEYLINIEIYIDNMTAVMLLMVSGAAFLVHLFSTYYMADDIGLEDFLFIYHYLLPQW